MKSALVRVLANTRKELKLAKRDKIMLFIFFIMPIICIGVVKLTQNTKTFSATIGVLDYDNSVGYHLNDSFGYTSTSDLQAEWRYNQSSNAYLNLTNGRINFTTSTLIQNEQTYLQREFNTISDSHNEILKGECEVYIVNASLSFITPISIGLLLGDLTIIPCGITFLYGNITAINGSELSTIQSVENSSLYQLEMTVFLKNHTYAVSVNGSPQIIYNFAIDISTVNLYQAYVYPSASFFDSVTILLDEIEISVDSTPGIDLSRNLSQYFEEESGVVYYTSEDMAKEDLLHRRIGAYVIIPSGFEENMTQDLPITLDIHLDGTNRHEGPELKGDINEALGHFRVDNGFLLDFIVPDIQDEYVDDIYVGPIWIALLIPPMITIAFMGSMFISTMTTIVDDEPLPRLLLTPITKSEIILSKFISFFILAILQIILFSVCWIVVFPLIGWQQSIIGSLTDCFLFMLTLSIVGIGLGFTTSTISKTKGQAQQYFIAIFVVLLILWLIRLVEWDPLTQGELALSYVIFKGLPFIEIAEHFLPLIGYAAITILVSLVIFYMKKYLV